jgi:hypothetical protein
MKIELRERKDKVSADEMQKKLDEILFSVAQAEHEMRKLLLDDME